MLPELAEMRKRRVRFGLTQSGLAQRAGVSQSLIALFESGAVVASYGNAIKIIDFLESLHEETQAKAADFMAQKVISVRGDDSLKEAVRAMKRHAVSQLPVIDDGKNIGTISEKIVLDKMCGPEDMNEVSKLPVREVMAEAMPTIKEDTPFRLISGLLEHNQGVLVAKKGKITGIITKSDLLGAVLEKKKNRA